MFHPVPPVQRGALSSVLAAFHLPQERIRSALRISFSYETDEEQLKAFAAALREVIDRLKKVVGGKLNGKQEREGI